MKREKLLGMETLMGRLAEVAALPPNEVRNILNAQLDVLALSSNDAAIECFETLKDPNATTNVKEGAIELLSKLGFFSDSVSRQRISLMKELQALPPGAGDTRPQILAPSELDDKEWERKYSQQQLPPPEPPTGIKKIN